MLKTIGDDLPYNAQFKINKLGADGLTVTANVYRNGASLLAGQPCAFVGDGVYRYVLDGPTYVTVEGDYVVVFTTADTSVDDREIASVWYVVDWIALIDAAISGRAAAGSAMTLASGAISANTFAADVNTYQAKIEFIDDDNGTTDRYVISWFMNGEPVSGAITTPVLQVIKVSDGTDLIPATAMAVIPGDNGFTYAAVGAERMVSGVAYLAIATATIDSSTREWKQPIGVDS